MPPKQTIRLPLPSAYECGCADMIPALIGHDTPSLARWITPGSVTPRFLAQAEIEDDSDHGSRIIDVDEDPLSDRKSDHYEDTPEPNNSVPDNDEPTAPSKLNVVQLVKRQQIMIDILLQHNTNLLERCGSSTSDQRDMFKMAQPKLCCGGA